MREEYIKDVIAACLRSLEKKRFHEKCLRPRIQLQVFGVLEISKPSMSLRLNPSNCQHVELIPRRHKLRPLQQLVGKNLHRRVTIRLLYLPRRYVTPNSSVTCTGCIVKAVTAVAIPGTV